MKRVEIDSLEFVKLDINGVRELVNWAEKEGWNPGPYDAEVYYHTDPDGFYGFFLDGELIAGGAIISYNGLFGFMGLFIVKPEYRTHGIGRKLWYQRRDLLLERLNKGAAIGMDGVIDMQSFYARGGFSIAFRDERYERIGGQFSIDDHISRPEDGDLSSIFSYDTRHFGYPREEFLSRWIQIPGNRVFKYSRDNIIAGYAILRKAAKGYKICPLFADDDLIAEELYKACLDAAGGEAVYIDIPVINPGAVNLVKKYEATYVFECARMYYGRPTSIDWNKIFGITTFELG